MNESGLLDTAALFRTFANPDPKYFPDVCAFQNPTVAPIVDPCHWTVLFVHPICNKFKMEVLKKEGLWFMDDEHGACPVDNSTISKTQKCLPLAFKQPRIEDVLLSCNEYRLAFTYIPRKDKLPIGEYTK